MARNKNNQEAAHVPILSSTIPSVVSLFGSGFLLRPLLLLAALLLELL
jgi:hypothetical protein